MKSNHGSAKYETKPPYDGVPPFIRNTQFSMDSYVPTLLAQLDQELKQAPQVMCISGLEEKILVPEELFNQLANSGVGLKLLPSQFTNAPPPDLAAAIVQRYLLKVELEVPPEPSDLRRDAMRAVRGRMPVYAASLAEARSALDIRSPA